MLILIIAMLLTSTPAHILFNFTPEADISDWRTIDDTVMGGRSDGNFTITDQGHGRYFGKVSLENNGGFSSLRYRADELDVREFKTICLRVKGDGSRYQLRTKSSLQQRYSYVQYFETTGEWETIKMQLADGEAYFRGRDLDLPNYPGEILAELGILIGNKEEQKFELLIDWIGLE